MDAIRPDTFIIRLKALGELPRKKNGLLEYRVHGDLSIERLPSQGIIASLIPKPQVINLLCLGVLQTLEREISRDDFKMLNFAETLTHLAKAMRVLHKYIWKHITGEPKGRPFVTKYNEIISIIFENLPLVYDENGIPIVNFDYYKEFFASRKYHRGDFINFRLKDCYEASKNIIKNIKKDEIAPQKIIKHIALLNTQNVKKTDTHKRITYLVYRTTLHLLLKSSTHIYDWAFIELIFIQKFQKFKNSLNFTTLIQYFKEQLIECVESYDASHVKLTRFHTTYRAALKFLEYYSSNKEKLKTIEDPLFFAHVEKDVSQHFEYLQRYNFLDEKCQLIDSLLPHLPTLVEKQSDQELLKELCLYTHAGVSTSLLLTIVKRFCKEDISESEKDKKPVFVKISRLHNAGFLVEEGENLRISDPWIKIMDLLIPNSFEFIKSAFVLFESLPHYHPKHEYFLKFLKGSSLVLFPGALVYYALNAGQLFHIDTILNAESTLAQNLKTAMDKGETHVNFAELITKSAEVGNSFYVDVAYKKLVQLFHIYLTGKNLLEKKYYGFLTPESILYEVITRFVNEDTEFINQSITCIHLGFFPRFSLRCLNLLIKKYPHINFHGVETGNKTSYSDLVINYPQNKEPLFISTEVLIRSSEYFKALLSGNFHEKVIDGEEIEIPYQEFVFLERWAYLIYSPKDNHFLHYLADIEKLKQCFNNFNLFDGSFDFLISNLHSAQKLQMTEIFDLLDRVFTQLITPGPQNNVKFSCESYNKYLNSLKPDCYIRTQLKQIHNSQFAITLRTFDNISELF